jgi:hypothetical protein
MVSRKSENPGYETLWDLMCKVGCGDMRRSVAFARNPNISMQQRMADDTAFGARAMCMNRSESDAAVERMRLILSPREVEPKFEK